MTAKFLTAVLIVAAFGCARATPVRPAPKHATAAPAPRARIPQALVANQGGLQPVAGALAPVEAPGVALHGPAKPYVEQQDNSGWSGRSPAPPPEGVGGGPPEEPPEYQESAEDADQEQAPSARPAE